MLRIILGIVAGIVAAFAGVMAIELTGHQFFPQPSDLNMRDPEQIRAAIDALPLGAMLFVIAAWFGGALVGGVVAKLISQRVWAAWAIAGVVALAGIMNILMIPHPLLMQIGAVAAPLLGGLLAAHIGRPQPGRTAAANEPGEGAHVG